MRRRLFWTIAGVAAVTGLMVLIGTVYAFQRVAVDATRRELALSSQEVVSIIEDSLEQTQQRPGATIELIRLLESDEFRGIFGRIRRTAGSSTLAFAVIGPEGQLGGNDPLFGRIALRADPIEEGESQFVRSTENELVLVTPVEIPLGERDVILLVALAREAPVIVLGDMFRGVLLIGGAVLLVSAGLARALSGQITRRLAPLSMASRDLAEGDLGARVPDLGDPELNEVAEAFNEMAETLESTNEREREFLLGIGHDLRTPLTTIGGYAEALEAGGLDPEEVERIGGVLEKQSAHLARLIEDLTLLARLDQPEFDLRIEEVDVGGHLEEIVESYRRRSEEAGVGLEFEAEAGVVASTDPDRLAQIVQNLLENALRFTPEGGRITVAVQRKDPSKFEVVVADTGVGIRPDDLEHIFDRHFVGKQRQIQNEGSGLGLSIVKGLTSRLGGSVAADSAPGKGTTVRVLLAG